MIAGECALMFKKYNVRVINCMGIVRYHRSATDFLAHIHPGGISMKSIY